MGEGVDGGSSIFKYLEIGKYIKEIVGSQLDKLRSKGITSEVVLFGINWKG